MEYVFAVYTDNYVCVYHDYNNAKRKARELHKFEREYELDRHIEIIKRENTYFKINKPKNVRPIL